MKLKVKRGVVISGKPDSPIRYGVGESFQVDDEQGGRLIKLGTAEPVDDDLPKRGRPPKPKADDPDQ